ncbi:MAG: hypothetical protein Q8O74_05205 [bacterium]|nr:hypothetical protein [bacterium]
MKKSLLAALFVMVISSWCLAQTDSLPAPTAEPCQPATCSGPCQTGACAAPCQQVPCAEPFVPKWAVGLKASSLNSLPGSIIVEKMFGLNNSLRLIVNGDYQNDDAYYIYNKWWIGAGIKWFHRFNFDRFQFIKPSFGFGLIYTREEYKSQYSGTSNYNYSYNNNVRLCVPLALMHYFKVAENNFAVGVEADIVNVEVEQGKQEERNIFTGNTYVVGPSTNVQAYLFGRPYFVIKYIFK